MRRAIQTPRPRARRMVLVAPSYEEFLDSQSGVNWWHLQELFGAVALATNGAHVGGILASSAYPGPELLDNSDFLNWSGIVPDDQPDGDWVTIETPLSGYVTENPTGQLQIISDGTVVALRQLGIFTIGKRYKLVDVISSYSSGSTNSGFQGATENVIVANSLATFTEEAIADSTGFQMIRNATPLDMTHDSISATEANPLNIRNTGMAVGQPGAGNVPFMYSGDGGVTRLTLDSIAEYNSIINMDNGGKSIIVKVDTWAAGVDVIWRSAVDANNEIVIYRDGADLVCEYNEQGNAVNVTLDTTTLPGGSPTVPFTIEMDWDVAGDGLRAFFNGVQSGAAAAIAAAIVGNLDIDECAIAAADTAGANSLAGDVAHAGLWTRTPETYEHVNYYLRSGI